MLNVGLTLLAIFLLLSVNELLWRKKIFRHEVSRKLIHIIVAVFVSFWPYYLSYKTIGLIAIAFLIVVILSRQFKIFMSINDVSRTSYGDIFFALGILALAIFAPAKAIFTIALLCVGLSDGLAAIIGVKYGRNNRYKIFHNFKSMTGTITVAITTFVILILVNYFRSMHLPINTLIIVPLVVALVESVSVLGTDNFFIPISVLVMISLL
ncbi:MAG TPA: hypothetical protein VMR76_03465 [Candidatus Saccharimonadia bacterium]|nr:hypothetical protein [Candidatus Saccharimonadia bacterium]